MNTLNTVYTRKLDQKHSELELEIQRLSELEAKEFAELERRYTEDYVYSSDDLTFAWAKGYETRINEESEAFWTS